MQMHPLGQPFAVNKIHQTHSKAHLRAVVSFGLDVASTWWLLWVTAMSSIVTVQLMTVSLCSL